MGPRRVTAQVVGPNPLSPPLTPWVHFPLNNQMIQFYSICQSKKKKKKKLPFIFFLNAFFSNNSSH